MHVAIAVVTLHLPAARSLKEKRGTLQSLLTRLRARHNLSVAEVEGQDASQRAVLGLCAVNTSYGHAHQALQEALHTIDHDLVGHGAVVGVWQEVLSGFGEE